MKKLLIIAFLLIAFVLQADIQVEQGNIDWRIYEQGTPATQYFQVYHGRVMVGNSATTLPTYLNGGLYIGKDDTGHDVVLYGATSSSYMQWDESADMLLFEASDAKFGDDDYLLFGDATSGDVQMSWNGTYFETAPVSGFWANCPNLSYPDASLYFHYFEDFIGHVNFPAASGAGGGWTALGDATYDVLNAAGTIGGIVQLSAEAGSDKEVYFQLGELGTETYIEYVKDSGNKSWVEFRVAASSITGAANWFVGLAEEGAAVADFIVDTGDSTANVDMVGFVVWEGDPNAIDCNYQLADSNFVDAGLSGVPVANTFLTLGLYFDGVQTVTWYHNGTAVQTADIDNGYFPAGEEMSPIIAIKQGAANVTLSVDWIRIVAER